MFGRYAPGPTKPSTPGERSVIVWALILALVGFGTWFVYLGLTAAPEKAQTAAQVRIIGFCFIGCAIALYLIRWAIRRWMG